MIFPKEVYLEIGFRDINNDSSLNDNTTGKYSKLGHFSF